MFTKLNPGTGDKPLFLKSDNDNIVRPIVLAFRLRSRHPVRPKGRTAYNENDFKTNTVVIDLRNRPARVGSSNSICSPILFTQASPHTPPLTLRRGGRPGRVGSLKTWVWQVAQVGQYQLLMQVQIQIPYINVNS